MSRHCPADRLRERGAPTRPEGNGTMSGPYTHDTPKLKLKIAGQVGLANREPPFTPAEFDSEVIGSWDADGIPELKITLKVYFKAMNPPDAPADGTKVKAWGIDPQKVVRAGYNDGDFAAFKRIVLA